MTIDCLAYNKNLPYHTNFVRLVGQHQAYYFILCNTILLCFFAFFDSLLISFANLLVCLIYVPFVMYLINRFMEEKKEQLTQSNLAVIVTVATVVSCVLYLVVQKETANSRIKPEVKYPLFVPYDQRVAPAVSEDGEAPEDDPNLFFLWKVKLDGFIAFYNWVLYPIYSWIIWPFIWVFKFFFGLLLWPFTFVWGLIFGSEEPEEAVAIVE